MAQGRIDEAIRHYEAFVRLSPGNPRGLLQLAAAYAAVGRFPEAAATAREAAAIATDHDLKELAAQMEQRAAAYASGQPYCER